MSFTRSSAAIRRKIRALTSALTAEDLRAIKDRTAQSEIWQEVTSLLDEQQAAG